MFWAGDSRAYVFEPDAGARQLTTDDIRDRGDAMANLREDSVVSNAMSADTDFLVNHRKVELTAPFLVVAATDGCFGYLPSPMHFEHLVLAALRDAPDTDSWSAAVQAQIGAVTGDDAAMAVLGIGADHDELPASCSRGAPPSSRQRWVDAAGRPRRRACASMERTARGAARDPAASAQAPAVGGVQAGLRAVPRTRRPPARRRREGRATWCTGYRLLEDFRVVGAGLSEWTLRRARTAGSSSSSGSSAPPTRTTPHRAARRPRHANAPAAPPSRRTTVGSRPRWPR